MLESFGILSLLFGAAGVLFLVITGVGRFIEWVRWIRRTQ